MYTSLSLRLVAAVLLLSGIALLGADAAADEFVVVTAGTQLYAKPAVYAKLPSMKHNDSFWTFRVIDEQGDWFRIASLRPNSPGCTAALDFGPLQIEFWIHKWQTVPVLTRRTKVRSRDGTAVLHPGIPIREGRAQLSNGWTIPIVVKPNHIGHKFRAKKRISTPKLIDVTSPAPFKFAKSTFTAPQYQVRRAAQSVKRKDGVVARVTVYTKCAKLPGRFDAKIAKVSTWLRTLSAMRHHYPLSGTSIPDGLVKKGTRVRSVWTVANDGIPMELVGKVVPTHRRWRETDAGVATEDFVVSGGHSRTRCVAFGDSRSRRGPPGLQVCFEVTEFDSNDKPMGDRKSLSVRDRPCGCVGFR